MCQLLHGMSDAALERVLEVSTSLALHSRQQFCAIELLEFCVDVLHLLGSFVANHLDELCLICTPSIHGFLHCSTVSFNVKFCFCGFEHANQRLLEVSFEVTICLARDVLNEIPAIHALISLFHFPSFPKVQLANDSDELVVGCAKSNHGFVQDLCTAVFWGHRLVDQNLFVTERSLALDVLQQSLPMLLVVLLENWDPQPLWDGAHKRCE
mmetsp:Transcript_20598/g.37041  ORF Transcript_20598/g.37041 Transcript_20598/m.37041 type:complete len:211 (-) Transcript_20598:645-1277(-)